MWAHISILSQKYLHLQPRKHTAAGWEPFSFKEPISKILKHHQLMKTRRDVVALQLQYSSQPPPFPPPHTPLWRCGVAQTAATRNEQCRCSWTEECTVRHDTSSACTLFNLSLYLFLYLMKIITYVRATAGPFAAGT